MNAQILEKLYEDLPVDIKQGAGNFKYIKTRYVLDRLNKVFEGRWSAQVINHQIVDNEVLLWIRLTIVGEGNVEYSQDGFGSAKRFDKIEIGNTYKSAKSKAIKDAVKAWGIGLFIEEPRNTNTVISNTTSMNNSSNIPVGNTLPPAANMSVSSNVPPTNGKVNTAQAMPAMNTNNTPPMGNSVPNTTMANNTPSSAQEAPGNLPSFTTPTTGYAETTQTSQPTQDMNRPPSPHEATNEGMMATLVQKTAIQTRLEASGQTFDELITDVYVNKNLNLEDKPATLDELTYETAMAIAAFNN